MMNATIRQLPDHPDLRLLENEASELLENGSCTTQAEARFKLAHLYGFKSWAKLEAYVSSIGSMGELEQAIQDDDDDRVKRILDEDPGLIHREGHWVKRRRHNGYLARRYGGRLRPKIHLHGFSQSRRAAAGYGGRCEIGREAAFETSA